MEALSTNSGVGGLEASEVGVDGVAFEWVTSNAFSSLLDPASGSDACVAATGLEVDSKAVVASDALRLIQLWDDGRSPLTVRDWLSDVLTGVRGGGCVWNGVLVVGAGDAVPLSALSEVEVILQDAIGEGGFDALLLDLGVVEVELVGVPRLAVLAKRFGGLAGSDERVQEALIALWEKRATALAVGEEFSPVALLTLSKYINDGTAVIVGLSDQV